jgi:hypothetical protein
LITPNEALLQRALDREFGDPTTRPVAPGWLGSSANLELHAKAFDLILKGSHNQFQQWMQHRAWDNLPILNEWKTHYPDQDPVQLHERIWHTRLLDRAGGTYVWNAKWHTMESTVYGHPGEPKDGPDLADLSNGIIAVKLGLTFEEQGLRGVAELRRQN